MPWCLGIVLLMQAPAAGQCPYRNVCAGNRLQETKTMSSVQLHVKPRKEHVEEEEPLPGDTNNSIPALHVAEVSSPVATLLLKFKQVSMLLRDHMLLRLQQWHEFETNMGQQSSVAVKVVLAEAVVGILTILILTFAVLNCVQAGSGHSAQSDYPRSGQGRGFSDGSQIGSALTLTTPGGRFAAQNDHLGSGRGRGWDERTPALLSVSTLTAPNRLTHNDLTPQQPQTIDAVGRLSTKGQGPEGAEEYPEPCSHICLELVVPAGCNCVVKVPTATLSQGPFRITNVYDKTVLYVKPLALNARSSAVLGRRDAELRLQDGFELRHVDGKIAAQCRPSLTQPSECDLLRATGDHFAKLTGTEEKAYTLTTCTGLELFFRETSKKKKGLKKNSRPRTLQ